MGQAIIEVMVFRTNVMTCHDAYVALFALHAWLYNGEQATIDLEDCDKVLRVETYQSTRSDIISALGRAGYQCIELEDVIPVPTPGF